VTLALASHHGASLQTLYQLRPDLPTTAFFELVDQQIGHYHPDDQRFTLLPVTRTALLTYKHANNIDLSEYFVEALERLLAVNTAPPVIQIPFLEQTLKTVLDSQIPLPFTLVDQAFSTLQTQPAIRTPAIWLRLLEWHYRQQPQDVTIGLELARSLRKVQDWERAQLEIERALENSGLQGDFILQAQVMTEFAVLMRQRGAHDQARRLLDRAQQIALRYRTSRLSQAIQLNNAQIAIDEGNPQLAMVYLDELPVSSLR
jgi:tetratricopeptide (TPR) repeat protein